jgi:hypothetical protein
MQPQAPSRPEHHDAPVGEPPPTSVVWLAAALFAIALAVVALGATAG